MDKHFIKENIKDGTICMVYDPTNESRFAFKDTCKEAIQKTSQQVRHDQFVGPNLTGNARKLQ